eukprot:TRINITY_DN38989_c0_g1_i1.p1 TRINITY_DN38989_c0_g1~~TRINITY_DN38989_c0_g1_i1.p1  ORF type:complete len:446 (+),score=55.18 TRINITY_DN38989_c0_g1_i1:78-1415(+)
MPEKEVRTSVYAVPVSYSGPVSGDECRLDVGIYLVTVGLPGRGKTFVANKICRYLSWIGVKAKCFLVSDYLRMRFGDSAVGEKKFLHDYYKISNEEARKERKAALGMALEDAETFLSTGTGVAIIDGQAAEKPTREQIEEHAKRTNCKTIFIELMETNETVEQIFNLKYDLMDDRDTEYSHLNRQQAFTDFKQRIAHLEATYTHVDPIMTDAYITISADKRTSFKGIHGYVGCKMLSWLPNLSALNRFKHPIYFVRHGESEYNLQRRIGGDPVLSSKGAEDGVLICEYIKGLRLEGQLEVWTSTLKRTIQTVSGLLESGKYKHRMYHCLNEINAGVCENLTYDELEASHPEISKWRNSNKFAYRYPNGESYQDLVLRIEPIIMDIEASTSPVLVVSHQAVLRTLFAYFNDKSVEVTSDMSIPQATVWCYTPSATGMGKLMEQHLR